MPSAPPAPPAPSALSCFSFHTFLSCFFPLRQVIRHARIPIIKLRAANFVSVDVSVSDDSGPRAARYILQQSRQYPGLKPLVLVIKAYLKALGLNEVANGGLSSYGLTNMVIAHLQEELKQGRDVSDLGETLYGFLLRYGEEYSYELDAVSVASGGIVPKAMLGFAMETARLNYKATYENGVPFSCRLCVDCPLTGRDVSNGSYRIDLVREAFAKAARRLEGLARGRPLSDTSLNYLSALFDMDRITQRIYYNDSDDYFTIVAPGGGGPPRSRQGRRDVDDEYDYSDDDYDDDEPDADSGLLGDYSDGPGDDEEPGGPPPGAGRYAGGGRGGRGGGGGGNGRRW